MARLLIRPTVVEQGRFLLIVIAQGRVHEAVPGDNLDPIRVRVRISKCEEVFVDEIRNLKFENRIMYSAP